MARRILLTMVTLIMGAHCAPAWAMFESDTTLAEHAKISMVEAIVTARQTIPGRPIHAQMGKDGGHTVYQIQILDNDGKSRWVYVDTMTGAVTEVKR
jgi:uncharacterized membrane protein YkoI